MTINSTRHVQLEKKHGLYCSFKEHVSVCLKNKKRNEDSGALLVEVLVGMFILVLVFSATTMGLSSMANERVKIEQRDRALALAAGYAEQAKTFQCGFVVDRISDSLTKTTAPGSGLTEFKTKVDNCDFEAKEPTSSKYLNPDNAGDQDFVREEPINENSSVQKFTITIRYWYESPGSDLHTESCGNIQSSSIGNQLPIIMTRAVNVTWKENGIETDGITVLKRDTVPTDNVVFASGNRVNLLINKPSIITDNQDWEANFTPYPGSSNYHITRYMDKADNRLEGQPHKCAWYPYITPDGIDRNVKNYNEAGTPIPSPGNFPIPTNTGPQSFIIK